MNKGGYRLRIFLIIFMFFFVSFSFYAYQIFFASNFTYNRKNYQVVDKDTVSYLLVGRGATYQNVIDSLTVNNQLQDKLSFAFISKLSGYRDKIIPGRYQIRKNASNLDVIKILKNGRQTPVKLTFTNIRLKSDLVQRLSSKFAFEKEDLDSLLNDPAFTKQLGFDTTTIVSMFIPNTYEVYWTTSARDLCERMNKEYKTFWNESRLKKAEDAGLTPVQVSILASIVEEETKKNDEKPRVAGVYINRLRSNMPLQADPTVKFAVGDFSLKRLYSGHLEKDSPYNTYKYTGLPPGPIYVPSIPSIDAVLNYEKHKYIYFVASEDLNGTHNFAETFEEHLKYADKYRKALNLREIK